jgi:hypothetical protein
VRLLFCRAHHHNECSTVGIAGVVDETGWAAEMKGLDVKRGFTKEVIEGEDVRGWHLCAGVLVLFDRLVVRSSPRYMFDELALLDRLRGSNTKATMSGHEDL